MADSATQDDLIASRLNEIYGPDRVDSSLDTELALLQHRTLTREKQSNIYER